MDTRIPFFKHTGSAYANTAIAMGGHGGVMVLRQMV